MCEGHQVIDLHQNDEPGMFSTCDIRMGCVDCGKVNPGHLHCCCGNGFIGLPYISNNINYLDNTTFPGSTPKPKNTPNPNNTSKPKPNNTTFPGSTPIPISTPKPVMGYLPKPPVFKLPNLFNWRNNQRNKCKKEGHQVVDLHQNDKPGMAYTCDIRMGCVDCGKVNPGHLHCCC